MFAKIMENPAFEPKSIILEIEEKFRYHISYGKAYIAKKKVMEMRWGTYEASYDNLPLVGIIELFLYRTMKYFLERANVAHAAMQDPQKVYSTWMTEYLTKKTEGCSLSQSLARTSTS
jgi:hypothetical protein